MCVYIYVLAAACVYRITSGLKVKCPDSTQRSEQHNITFTVVQPAVCITLAVSIYAKLCCICEV